MTQTDGRRLLGKAFWIWPEYRLYDLTNTYAHFRKDFELEAPLESAILYITADQSYRLWVNGQYVTRGPARGYQAHWPYDEVELAPYLREGKNYICAEVYNPGVSTFSYISQTSAGFLCAGDFGNVRLRSDASWLSRLDRAHKKDTAHYTVQLAFQEHVDARKDDRSWISSPDMPKGWSHPQETAFGSMPWHEVEERGIPQLREVRKVPEKVVSRATGKAGRGYRSWRNAAEGLYFELKNSAWISDNANAAKGIEINPAGKGRYQAVIVDMGDKIVGPAVITVEGGKAGSVLDLFYHEVLDERHGPAMLLPDSDNCELSMANRLILSEGRTVYEFYQLIGFRYVTIIAQENVTALTVKITVNDTGYPYTLSGGFECSDKVLNGIWKICSRTEQVCSLDTYVDTPWREQAQWWGDARIQFWNTMVIDGDVRLFKRGIRSIAGQRVPNGLTYGHAPTTAHTCILPDFSLVWIVTIYDYYRQTGDLSLFVEQLPRIRDVLSYFRKEAPKNKGLLSFDPRYWLFLDWSDLQKEGSPTLYNMWYLFTLRILTQLLENAGLKEEADETGLEARQLQTAIEALTFDEGQGLFCDGLDEYGQPTQKYSVHSQTFAIMLGMKPEFHDIMMQKRLLPFLQGENLDAAIPSTYWTSYVLTVAREKGFGREALDYIKRMWSPMIPLGTCTEIFDIAGTDNSASHAWSAHPVFHLVNLLGGIVQEATGWDTILFKPYFAPELDSVKVKVPTPHGLIESTWRRKEGKIDIKLHLPCGITAKVDIPGQEKMVAGDFNCSI